MSGRAVAEALGAICILAALGILAAWLLGLTGCTVPTTVLNKADIAAFTVPYGEALERCKAKGKAQHSYAVFEACETFETAELCKSRPSLRDVWAACKEVEP